MIFKLHTREDDERPVFLAGTFNNWQENDSAFQMNRLSDGHYQFEFSTHSLSFPIEYKYIRGGWSDVELDAYGNYVPNHRIEKATDVVLDLVPRWQNYALQYQDKYLPDIRVSQRDFDFPEGIKTRRIAALLPHDYEEQVDKHYPVLYLQDGQNLYDDYAPYGSWGVDKKMAMLAEKGMGDIIIIAIDHAREKRISEYTPTDNPRTGKGLGRAYTRFLAETLKPHIDKYFRTLPGREHTGIGGSSMGGLISIYAGLLYPETFSKLMIFSPSLWVEPNIHFHAMKFKADLDSKIYLYAGGAESKNMVPNVERFLHAISNKKRKGHIDFKFSLDPAGGHHEAQWGKEFPDALKWLFFS